MMLVMHLQWLKKGKIKEKSFKQTHFNLGFLAKSPPKTSNEFKRKHPICNPKHRRNFWNKGFHNNANATSNFENWMEQMKKKIDKPIMKIFGDKDNSFLSDSKPIETRKIIKPREAFTVHGNTRRNQSSQDHESKSTSQFFSEPMQHYKMTAVDYSNRCKK